ncbi:MAG: cation-transporting P-type ATPase [Phycisphaeraceae bacterium]
MPEPTQDDIPNEPWHALEAEQALQRLDSTAQGLTRAEAERRLEIHGPNRLKPPPRRSAFERFVAQFHNVLIYVLIGAAVVTALLGDFIDSAVIAAVIIINAIIGYIQEGKAEQAINAIRNLLSLEATVLRDGTRTTINAEKLVPGDIVYLQAGDKVPADLRLLRERDLQIDEAPLTGESVPTEKAVEPVDEAASIGDRVNLAFSGTLVTYGTATGVVVGTAEDTEIGRISGMLAEIKPLTTRLLQEIAQFGRWLTAVILGMTVLIFAVGVLWRDFTAEQMFQACVGLAVAAIPEGLPAVITITLALGVQRMARRNAIIRRLPAVETLGSVTVICSDKTGTLTRNEMTVQTVAMLDEQLEVTGVGYGPSGRFSVAGRAIDPAESPRLLELSRAAVLCNEATISREDDGRHLLHGDPTEGALVTLAMKAGHNDEALRDAHPAIDTIPFQSEHRFMATLHEVESQPTIYLKGAPERVLEMCDRARNAHGEDVPIDHGYWHQQMDAIASRGQRLLAVAVKRPAPDAGDLSHHHVESGLTLLGMVGIIDPPREDATAAVRACHGAGIRVKMITGDHGKTATAIGSQMGIGRGREAVTGADLDALDPQRLREIAHASDVFARVSPEHKLRLVAALQKSQQVVAMTGDGVNDAPALKRADVGVAMGLKGTEAAKEASEMVLADDNFATIAHAVEEGRTVYDNIRKSLLFLLPTNGAQAGIIIVAVLLGLTLPVTALQILWVNMVSAVTLALALAFELPERGVMHRAPRDPAEPILTPFLVWRIFFVSVMLVAGAFGLYAWVRMNDGSLELARTVAVNTIVMGEIFYLLNSRYLYLPVLNLEGIFGNRYVLIAIAVILLLQLAFTYAPPLQLLFETQNMPFDMWWRIIGVALLIFLAVELEKTFWRRRDASAQQARNQEPHP